jgi:mannose-1-phosphate guanylyltransferase
VQAVILVGGFGTRLRPLTRNVPKQMLPVVDRPMIEHVVAHLAAHGVTRVVLSLGFRPEAFFDAYPDGICAGLPLHYAVEPEPLDTAGAVRFAALEAGIGADDDTFLVMNGDVLTDLDIGAMVSSHRSTGAEATLALTEVDDPSRYGLVPTDVDGRVLGFLEKPAAASAPTRWINAGTYLLQPSILDRIPAGRPVSVEREVFPTMAVERRLHAVQSDAYWIDTGTLETYVRAQLDLVDGSRGGLPAIHPSALVDPGADVRRSVAMAGATVGPGARLCDAVVMDGGSVGAGAVVDHSVVGPGALVGSGASVTELTVLGAGVVVGVGQLLRGARVPEDF